MVFMFFADKLTSSLYIMNEFYPLGAPRGQEGQKQGIGKEIIWFLTFREEHKL
jgi:hypothetical protein